jgi:Tfp pilus assembly protein PilW
MTAVIVTFITSSRVNNTVDSSRELQRNIKTAVEAIAEDVRKHGIEKIEKVG